MPAETTQAAIKQLLTSTPPEFSAGEAVSVALSQYGINGSVKPLVSDRDQNFRLDADDGSRYVLKFSNPAEQQQVVDFQSRALLHIEKTDAGLPVPRVIRDHEGRLHCTVEKNGTPHFVRVLSWLDGVFLEHARDTEGLAGRVGGLLARLGLALKDFDHPGSNPPLLWDMKRASGLRMLLDHVDDPGLKPLLAQILNRFDSKVAPKLPELRTQVIHSDMHLDNVVMDEKEPGRIAGVIDFGDMVKSPLIMDLAIAAAYQLDTGADPLRGALPMIAGYHAVRPLQILEMELLIDLIRTRLITSVLINAYRVSLFPENRDYLMVSYQSAINFLTSLQDLTHQEALDRIRSACERK